MQVEASTQFLTGTIRESLGRWQTLHRKSWSQLFKWERGHESQTYEWDRKLQGQGPCTQHSGPCTQLTARFRDGSHKSVKAGWCFLL